MATDNPATGKNLQRLREARHALLRLHKILLEYQRHVWERSGGTVANSYELLELVLHHPEFAWLRHLSEMVVQMDEMIDEIGSEKQPTESDAAGLLEQARLLLAPSEAGDEFQRKYFDSLQESPDVVLAHSEAVKLLGKKISNVH